MTRFEDHLARIQRFGIRPGLERIRALLALAGHPSQSYPHLLVGGTNGKGSTAQFLAQMLAQSAGKPIGLYTSPHLVRWNERIRIVRADAESVNTTRLFPDAISDVDLDALFEMAWPLCESVEAEHGPTTEFELMTLLGLWHFARCDVSAAVIEVGLGGLWDATNAAVPVVSVVTHVALDHCDRLGATLELIAADKIHIARPGRVVVTAETNPAVLSVFAKHCDQIGARLWPWRKSQFSNDQSTLESVLETIEPINPLAVEAPPFQILNHRTAQIAHRAFCQAADWPLDKAKSDANSPALWRVPGRFETIAQHPTIILDGANNPDGVAQLIASLQAARAQISTTGRLILVIGVSADKDYATMLQLLAPHVDLCIATQAASPRALPASNLAQAASKYFRVPLETIEGVSQAVERAKQIANAQDWIVVTGSFFVLGEVPR